MQSKRTQQGDEQRSSRRLYLKSGGASIATAGVLLSGCEEFYDYLPKKPMGNEVDEVSLGSGDIGVLNYAYALEQLEAAFYTEVRAYKGQAANLIDHNDVLTTALQIHSVEARHASEVRRLSSGQKDWITQDDTWQGMPSEVRAVYIGEAQTMQAGLDLNTVMGVRKDGILSHLTNLFLKQKSLGLLISFLSD